eukprot:351773-Chlamydomonas_euryale.AAC.9
MPLRRYVCGPDAVPQTTSSRPPRCPTIWPCTTCRLLFRQLTSKICCQRRSFSAAAVPHSVHTTSASTPSLNGRSDTLSLATAACDCVRSPQFVYSSFCQDGHLLEAFTCCCSQHAVCSESSSFIVPTGQSPFSQGAQIISLPRPLHSIALQASMCMPGWVPRLLPMRLQVGDTALSLGDLRLHVDGAVAEPPALDSTHGGSQPA